MVWYLSLGLDADIKGTDPGGKNTSEAFSGKRIEEVKARRHQLLETAPSLDDTDARLVYASADTKPRVSHLSLSLSGV